MLKKACKRRSLKTTAERIKNTRIPRPPPRRLELKCWTKTLKSRGINKKYTLVQGRTQKMTYEHTLVKLTRLIPIKLKLRERTGRWRLGWWCKFLPKIGQNQGRYLHQKKAPSATAYELANEKQKNLSPKRENKFQERQIQIALHDLWTIKIMSVKQSKNVVRLPTLWHAEHHLVDDVLLGRQ